MPYRRPIGSDRSISPAAGPRSSGAPTMQRSVPRPANATQTQPRRQPNRSVQYERNQPEAATSLLENDVGCSRAQMRRPRFAKLNASIAECPMEWAWQHPPSVVTDPVERGRSVGNPASAGLFARQPWLGGVAFALLAAGVISAVATVQSGGLLPAGEVPTARTLTAGHEPGADRPAPAAAPGSAQAGRERGATNTTVAPAGAARAVEIALLGPVLASAGEAEEVNAKLPMRTAAVRAAAIEARVAHLLREPPRPVFKPTHVSSADTDRRGGHAGP